MLTVNAEQNDTRWKINKKNDYSAIGEQKQTRYKIFAIKTKSGLKKYNQMYHLL